MSDLFTTISNEKLKKQEHLSREFLKKLAVVTPEKYSGRPTSSLAELMGWVKNKFAFYIYGTNESRTNIYRNLNVQINNKIIIDGTFLTFCKENKVNVKCLFRDSISSWQDEYKIEAFIAQGVFLIEYDGLKFIHAALFHKGNQFEDEVSFFIVVEDSKLHKYIEFRNKYEEWTQERDKSNSEIRVIGGDDILYDRTYDWDSVFLPDELKDRIRKNVEGFLKSKDIYNKMNIPWKRGMLLWGEAGCGKTSLLRIIMSQYSLKPVTINMNGHSSADDMLEEAFSYATKHSPSLLFLEDMNVLLTDFANVSHFLQLMDGINSKEGIIVVGTANDISSLTGNITDRPSRFSNKFEIPLPNKEMAKKYLKHRFKGIIKGEKIYKELSERACENRFSYAYLEEIYISAAFLAINAERDKPDISDVKQAMELLIKDKKDVNSDFRPESTPGIGIHTYEEE